MDRAAIPPLIQDDRVPVNQIPNIRKLTFWEKERMRWSVSADRLKGCCGDVHQGSPWSEGWRRCCGKKRKTSGFPNPLSLPTMAEDRQLPNIQEDCLLKVCLTKKFTFYFITIFQIGYIVGRNRYWPTEGCVEVVGRSSPSKKREKEYKQHSPR